MPHRDALMAAQERIAALERALDDARTTPGESVPTKIARLEQEKRALGAERDRLLAERERLTDDLVRAKAALTRAEDEAARLRRDARDAKQVRDQLRRQAVEDATRVAQSRRHAIREERASERPGALPSVMPSEARASEIPAAPRAPTAAPSDALGGLALDAHNRALPAPAARPDAGVLCTACAARGERVEMYVLPMALAAAGLRLETVGCATCGALGLRRPR